MWEKINKLFGISYKVYFSNLSNKYIVYCNGRIINPNEQKVVDILYTNSKFISYTITMYDTETDKWSNDIIETNGGFIACEDDRIYTKPLNFKIH